MADGMSLPNVRYITNELLHCGQTHSEPTRGEKSSELIPPGPRARESVHEQAEFQPPPINQTHDLIKVSKIRLKKYPKIRLRKKSPKSD